MRIIMAQVCQPEAHRPPTGVALAASASVCMGWGSKARPKAMISSVVTSLWPKVIGLADARCPRDAACRCLEPLASVCCTPSLAAAPSLVAVCARPALQAGRDACQRTAGARTRRMQAARCSVHGDAACADGQARSQRSHRRCRRRQHRLLRRRLPGAGGARRDAAAAAGAGRDHRAARACASPTSMGRTGSWRPRRSSWRPIRRRRFAEADIILVTVKSGATAAMAELIAEHAPSGVTVVSLQNGVGNVDVLLARLGGMARVGAGHGALQCRADARQRRAGALPSRHQRHDPDRRRRAPGLRAALNVKGAAVAEQPGHDGRAVGQAAAQPQQRAERALRACRWPPQLADRRWRLHSGARRSRRRWRC